MTDIIKAIKKLESQILDPRKGLPEEVFLFVSRITPLINVDLLIKNRQKQTLLTWRDDGIYPPGWHIPGGIIRYKEVVSDRLKAVAAKELGVGIKYRPYPIAINECIQKARKIRGHFISFLFKCTLAGPPDKKLKYERGIPRPGQWAWYDKCPDDAIDVHRELYGKYI